jgi:hypothetical protein
LQKDEKVKDILLKMGRSNKKIAAICAAPVVLHSIGLLENTSLSTACLSSNQLDCQRILLIGHTKIPNILEHGFCDPKEFSRQWLLAIITLDKTPQGEVLIDLEGLRLISGARYPLRSSMPHRACST